MTSISLIPFLCGMGAQITGCEQGPGYCHDHGLQKDLEALGHAAKWIADPKTIPHDYNDVPDLGSDKRRDAVYESCATLRDHVKTAIAQDQFPLVLGGDHSMAAGSIAGFIQAHDAFERTGLIWVDAHPDINTFDTTPSQSIHGMAVAAMIGMQNTKLRALTDHVQMLKAEHVFYIGIRDIDPGEQKAIDTLSIPHRTMAQIHETGLKEALQSAFETLSSQVDYLALSVDLDGLDPRDTPAVGSPVPGGPRHADFLPLLVDCVKQHKIDMLEVAEFNPTLSGAEQTYQALRDLVLGVLQ